MMDSIIDSKLFPVKRSYTSISMLEDDSDVHAVTILDQHKNQCPMVKVHYLPKKPIPTLPTNAALLYFKGNDYDLLPAVKLKELRRLSEATGLCVFAPEYPGYGCSSASGVSTVMSVDYIALEAYEYVISQGYDKVVVVGMSIGCGPAIRLCYNHKDDVRVVGLFTFSGWATISNTGWDAWVAATMSSVDRWNSLESAKSMTIPWCILHGDNDNTIPFQNGLKLYAQAPNAVMFQIIGSDHNDDVIMNTGCKLLKQFVAKLGISGALPNIFTFNANIVYCHGFNNTPKDLNERTVSMRTTVKELQSTPEVTVGLIPWWSAAGDANDKLQGFIHEYLKITGDSKHFTGAVSAGSYLTDNTNVQHDFNMPPGNFSIIAHSRGCHIIMEWLYRNRERWNYINKIAFLHPDVPRSAFEDRVPMKVHCRLADGLMKEFASEVQREVDNRMLMKDFAKDHIGCFDAQYDHATSASTFFGTIYHAFTFTDPYGGSRDIRDFCTNKNERIDGSTSHSVWLDDDERRKQVFKWLLGINT